MIKNFILPILNKVTMNCIRPIWKPTKNYIRPIWLGITENSIRQGDQELYSPDLEAD